MRKIFMFFVMLNLVVSSGFCQIPNFFNYQAVVRTSSGEVVSDSDVSFRISILQNSESGSAVYVETHTVRTNEFGLVNLKIGDGTVLTGDFNPGNWGSYSHFIKVEMDVNGGSSYTEFGTSQLMSVPYAFHAKTVENDEVDDADADPENEIQSISISGTQLTLSDGGGTVTLPSSGGGDNWGTQTVVTDATLSGEGTASNPLGIAGNVSPWQPDNGNIYFDSGKVTIGSDTPNTNGLLSLNGKSKNAWISFNNEATGNTLSDGLVIGPRLSDGAVYFWNLENTPIIFSTNNKERLIISEEGHVGIGTDPSGGARTFQVIKDDELTIAAENNTTSLPTMHLKNKSGGVAAWIVGKVVIDDGTEGLGKVLTSDDTGYASWQSPLWNKNGTSAYYNNGKVGIGTKSPSAGLHLKGSGYPSSFMFLESNSGQDAGFRLYEASTAKWHIFNNATAGGLQIYNSAAKTAIFARQSNSFIGIGTTSPTQALHVVGNAYKTEGGTSWATSSDLRLKNLLGNYSKGLDEIVSLQPVRYLYKKDNPRELNSTEVQVGFVAQEVQKLFPEAVTEGEDGYLDFNIHSINVAMVNAVKKLNEENQQLKKKISDLENRLYKLESYFELSASKK